MKLILLVLAGFMLIYFAKPKQSAKEIEIERFANRPDVKITDLGNNILEIKNLSTGSKKHVDISDQGMSIESFDDDIQVFDLINTPDSLFAFRYKFKNQIPIGQGFGNPLLFYDFDNNGKLDIAGVYDLTLKDNNLVQGGVIELQDDSTFALRHVTAYEDNAQIPLSITDVDKDGLVELNVKTSQHFRNYEAPSQDSLPTIMQFDHEMWQVSSIGSTELFTYFDHDSILDVFYRGDDTLSPRGGKVYIAEYDNLIGNFVQKFRFPPPTWDVSGVSIDDFDGDGFKEVETGSIHGDVYVIENSGDDNYSNTFTSTVNTSNAYLNCSTNDIDGNGRKEFFIGASSYWSGIGGTMVFWFEATGDNQYEVQRQFFLKGTSVLGTTQMYSYDMNVDGVDDLVFAFGYKVVILTWDNTARLFDLYYLYNHNGTEIQAITAYKVSDKKKPDLFISIYGSNNSPVEASLWFQPTSILDIGQESIPLLPEFTLFQNYPNPFNGTTKIIFSLKKQAQLTLTIYNQNGKEVKRLISKQGRSRGRHEVIWNGKNNAGKEVASGIYYYSLSINDFVKSKKLLYLK